MINEERERERDLVRWMKKRTDQIDSSEGDFVIGKTLKTFSRKHLLIWTCLGS